MLDKERKQLGLSLATFYQKPVARVSTELFLSIGAVIFFAVFAIRPTLLKMSDLIKEIDDKRLLDKQMAQKIASLSSAQSEYLKNQGRISVLDAAIPTGPNLVSLFKIFEKLASEQQLVITALSIQEVPKDVPADTPYEKLERKSLSFNIGVAGDYGSIHALVDQLGKTQRALVVDKVLFSVSEVRGTKQLSATIAITAPYYGLKK